MTEIHDVLLLVARKIEFRRKLLTQRTFGTHRVFSIRDRNVRNVLGHEYAVKKFRMERTLIIITSR